MNQIFQYKIKRGKNNEKNLLPKLVLPILLASSTIIGANQTKVSAAPIKDAEVKLTQPDGQVIQCYASGDEFYNYLHDSNGRAIVKDEKRAIMFMENM